MTATKGRNIKTEEKNLITSLLELADLRDLIPFIPEVVYDLNDGGMGSIKFTNDNQRIFGEDILEVNYIDADNTPVVIALTVDNKGDLFELDFWKVNFEKLAKYPEPEDIITS